jgi:ribose-phosphate pyrophosphokinase
VLFDDMISTAGSICGAASLVHDAGTSEIYVAASHGVFCGPALERIAQAPITSCVVTDSIPLADAAKSPKIKVLSVAPLLGEAIKRIHRNESVSRLFS